MPFSAVTEKESRITVPARQATCAISLTARAAVRVLRVRSRAEPSRSTETWTRTTDPACGRASRWASTQRSEATTRPRTTTTITSTPSTASRTKGSGSSTSTNTTTTSYSRETTTCTGKCCRCLIGLRWYKTSHGPASPQRTQGTNPCRQQKRERKSGNVGNVHGISLKKCDMRCGAVQCATSCFRCVTSQCRLNVRVKSYALHRHWLHGLLNQRHGGEAAPQDYLRAHMCLPRVVRL